MPRSNVILTKGVSLQTPGAVATELTRITVPLNTAVLGELRVGAAGGVAGATTAYYRFKIHASRATGNITLNQAVVDGTDWESAAGLLTTVTASGTDVVVTVTGIAVTVINWEADFDLIDVTLP